MIRGVRLNQLPDGLRFPPDLLNKISYDPNGRQLQFEGFMSKTDFDKLLRVHNDLSYQRALEQLFQKCTFVGENADTQTKPSAIRRWKFPAAGVAVAAVAITGWLVFGTRGTSPDPSRDSIVVKAVERKTALPDSPESLASEFDESESYTVAIQAPVDDVSAAKTAEAPR